MNWRNRVHRLVCPRCTEEIMSNEDRRNHTVSILERSVERLDRIAEEMNAIRGRMAEDHNPFLGDRSEVDGR